MEEKKQAEQAINQEVGLMSSVETPTSVFTQILKNQLGDNPTLMVVGSK